MNVNTYSEMLLNNNEIILYNLIEIFRHRIEYKFPTSFGIWTTFATIFAIAFKCYVKKLP